MSVWLATKEVAELYEVSERTIQRKASSEKFRFKVINNEKNRKSYLIDITSLPVEKQQEYIHKNLKVKSSEAKITDEKKTYTLGELKELYGEEKMEEYLLEAFKKVDIIEKVKNLDYGDKLEILEEFCKEQDVSIRTVYNWIDDYEKGGLAALMRKPNQNRGKSIKLDEEAIKFIRGFYLHGIQPKGSHVYKQYLKKAEKEGWDIASRATVYRELKRIPYDQDVYARRGKEKYNALCMPKATRDLSKLKVNEFWVGDGHKIAIIMPHNGQKKRLTLSAWLDMRSRTMVGWCIGPNGNSYIDGLAIRHGILPKDNSPVCGIPGFAYMDNGKDYRSKHLNGGTSAKLFDFTLEQEGLFKALGIATKFSTPYFAWSKPIERQFRTFSNDLSRFIIGFCGETPDERPHTLDEKEILLTGITIEQLAEMIEGYMRAYNNTPHSALNGKTPFEVYEEEEKFRDDMPREEELDILMMRAEGAAITPSGIKRFGVWFWDDALTHKVGEKAVIRFDPNRLGELYVYIDGQLYCKAQSKELLEMNASEEKIKELKRRQARARKEVKEAIDSYGVSEADVRRMMLEDYTDNEELLDIVCGKNSTGKGKSKVVRMNSYTKKGVEKNKFDSTENGQTSQNNFFAKMGEEFLKNIK